MKLNEREVKEGISLEVKNVIERLYAGLRESREGEGGTLKVVERLCS